MTFTLTVPPYMKRKERAELLYAGGAGSRNGAGMPARPLLSGARE